MILGIQILGIIFGLFMVYLSFLHYKRGEFGRGQIFFWEILWFGLIFLVLFPKTVGGIIEKLGIVRAMDLFVILGFIFIIFLTFYNYTTLAKIKQKLEKKVRNEALKDLKKDR